MASMKDLIDGMITILEAAQVAETLSTRKIFKGLQNVPMYAATNEFPYIMLDDGGETTEVSPNPDSTGAENRMYNVVFEVGTYTMNFETSLNDVLDINDELKTIIESDAVRTMLTTLDLDGFVWGVESTPFGWEDDSWFFRGRQIVVAFTGLADTIDKY